MVVHHRLGVVIARRARVLRYEPACPRRGRGCKARRRCHAGCRTKGRGRSHRRVLGGVAHLRALNSASCAFRSLSAKRASRWEGAAAERRPALGLEALGLESSVAESEWVGRRRRDADEARKDSSFALMFHIAHI